MDSDTLDASGTPNQRGRSPSPNNAVKSSKNTRYLPTIKQYEAGSDNRLVENIPLFGYAPAVAITTLSLSSDDTDLGVTKSITVGTALGNLVALLSIPFVRLFSRKYYHHGHYDIFVGAKRCSTDDILAMKKNEVLIYRDEADRLCYIVKGVHKKSFVEGRINRDEVGEKGFKPECYKELLNQSRCSPPDVFTPVFKDNKTAFLEFTEGKGHTFTHMDLNPLYRNFRTFAKIFGQIGTFISYFLGGDNPHQQRLLSFLLSGLLSVGGGLIAIPYYLISGKFPKFKTKYNLTFLDGWSKYVRTFQTFFTSIGQMVGGILVGTLKNAGAAATSFGISFWSSVIGLGGVVLGFTLIPLINWISSFFTKDGKGILISKDNDKNVFRNNYPRSGMLAFGAVGALIGIPFGFLALSPPVMATIFSAAFSCVGAIVFTVFGEKIHHKLHPLSADQMAKINTTIEGRKKNNNPMTPKEIKELLKVERMKVDLENSWDYVGRSSGSVFAFVGAAIACMVNPAAALVWAPVGAAIAGGIGWGLGILAMRKARGLKGNETEIKAETIPWTQRITMGSNIGSTIGAAIGVAVGMAGFVLAGPASVILAVSLFGAIGAVVGGIAGVLYEPLARRLIWQTIKDLFQPKSAPGTKVEPSRPSSQLSNSRTPSPKSPFVPVLQTTARILQSSPTLIIKPIAALPDVNKDPKYRSRRPFSINTLKHPSLLPLTSTHLNKMESDPSRIAVKRSAFAPT